MKRSPSSPLLIRLQVALALFVFAGSFPFPVFSQDHETLAREAEQAGDVRRAVEEYTVALQGSLSLDAERALREKVIALCLSLPERPTSPEEAVRHFVRGATFAKAARNRAELQAAASEYHEGLKSAPCVSDAYFNYAVLLEAINQALPAVNSFKLYLRAAPNASDGAKVRSKIYELEARLEMDRRRSSDWPKKSIHLIAPFGVGSAEDRIARLVAQKLMASLGQQVVVEPPTITRPVAKSIAAATAIARSTTDGYAVLLTSSRFSLDFSLVPNLEYGEKDFTPVVGLATRPYVLLVSQRAEQKSFQEFIDRYKNEKIAVGSSDPAARWVGEYVLGVQAKMNFSQEISYAGTASLSDGLGKGEATIACIPLNVSAIKYGSLRALAITSDNRHPALADVPTLRELGYSDGKFSEWLGIFMPSGTPEGIADKLRDAVNRALATPEIRGQLDSLGFVVNLQDDFGDYVKADIARWARIVATTSPKNGFRPTAQ